MIATLAWAWAFAANSPLVALALAPLTLLAALLALGAPLAARVLVAGRERHPGVVRVTLWPLGLLLSVLGAPLGVVYGRLLTARAAAQGATASAARSDAGYETLGEPAPARGARPAGAEDRAVWRGWGALGPAARVALAALLTNAALAVICGALYSQLGDPVTRILLVTNVAVLAFTGVSDPEADGWRVWRRSPLLWMLLFVVAAAALTALLLGAV